MIENLVFLGSGFNRTINCSNVKDLYTCIKNRGYISEVSKIEYLKGDAIKGSKLLSFEIVPKIKGKPISLSNWDIVYADVDWNDTLEAVVDGQHKAVALKLLELIDGKKLDDKSMYSEVQVPVGLTIPEFISMKNSGRAWVYKDFEQTNISSGNNIIDKILDIIKDNSLLSQVGLDLFTINTVSLSNSLVKGLKAGTHSLPKVVKLDQKSINDGLLILSALKSSSFLTSDRYNNTRFSKGLKRFVKDSDISISGLVDLIGKIDKAAWETYFTATEGSPEASFYKTGFENFSNADE